MMGNINSVVAQELVMDQLRTAESARAARDARSSLADRAALRRQRTRVQLSLLLVPRRGESAGKE